MKKIKIKNVPRKLWGYKTITSEMVGKMLNSENLMYGGLRVNIEKGTFASVVIRPEVYLLVGAEVKAMHNRTGFVYDCWLTYDAADQQLASKKTGYLFYEPFSEEVILLSKEVAKVESRPWWRKELYYYSLFKKEGVIISRGFVLRGGKLEAYEDGASSRVEKNVLETYYFPPMHFIYNEVPTAEELRIAHESSHRR